MDFNYYCKAIENWLVKNDSKFQDVTIWRRVNDPRYRDHISIQLKTNCTWEEYTAVKTEFEQFLKRNLKVGLYGYQYRLTIVHTKKIAA